MIAISTLPTTCILPFCSFPPWIIYLYTGLAVAVAVVITVLVLEQRKRKQE
jgi:hypothetical protein